MKICRLCLSESADDDNRIAPVLEHQVVNLAKKIMDCVSININANENLSKYICLDCVNQVLQWESFRIMCQKSNQKLLHRSNIKFQELEDGIINLDAIEVVKQEGYSEYTSIQQKNVDTYFDEDEPDNLETFKDFSELPNVSIEEDSFYECDICKQHFDNCFEYLDHQYTHSGEDIFKCDKCSEAFCTRDEVVHHERFHQVACPQCAKLILRTSMKSHLIKHTGKHKCTKCQTTCSSKSALTQHQITVHTDIKDHICDACGKCFSSASAMRVHYRTHSDDRMYPCKKCSYAGRTASALYIHMSTHATDLCMCEICCKTFKSNRNLTDHIRRVHTLIKKHQCLYCDKSFVDSYMLKVHTRWHTNVRPYKCTMCTKTFIRSDGLKEHMNTHKTRALVECGKCSKKFVSRQGIARHNCLAVS